MTQFVRGPNPIWYEFNTTGSLFDTTYYAFFLTNTLPYIPQAVYQDPNGQIPWSNPIEFQASGGLPNNIYFNPNLTYRIELRQGPTQNDVLIGNPIENYSTGTSVITQTDPLTTAPNDITNPQFSDLYFTSPITLTAAGTYNLGPGWKLVLTGSGSITVTQVLNAGNNNVEGNPPYYLTFNNIGFTAQLIQTFSNNGAIYASGAIAVSFSAFATSNPASLTVSYNPSTSVTTPDIFSGTIATGAFQIYQGAINVPASSNTDQGTAAFVNIEFNLPTNGTVSLTNIQVTGQSVPLSTAFNAGTDIPIYQEVPYERNVDHMFHVYRSAMLNLAKQDVLVGWNFPLNPWQFRSTTLANLANNAYTADQTIVIQQNYVASSTGNNIQVGQAGFANNQGLQIKAVTNTNQFAILQYIDPTLIMPYWNNIMSSMVKVQLLNANSTAVKLKMRLIYKSTLPATTAQNYPISSWTAGNEPVFDNSWTVIIPPNDPVYTLTTSVQSLPFNNIQLPAATTSTMVLGVVIYTIGQMDISPSQNSIVYQSVSLIPNTFALESPAKSFQQSLADCEYYYEKSYSSSDLAGAVTMNGARFEYSKMDVGAQDRLFITPFELVYRTFKRSTPTTVFYSPITGAINNMHMGVYLGTTDIASADVPISSYTVTGSNAKSIYLVGNDTASVVAPAYNQAQIGYTIYHYVADVRLGL